MARQVNGSMNLSHACAVALARVYEGILEIVHHDNNGVVGAAQNTLEQALDPTADLGEVSGSTRVHLRTRRAHAVVLFSLQLDALMTRWEEIISRARETASGKGTLDGSAQKNPERLLAVMRRLMLRANPSSKDVAFVHGFLRLLDKAL
eukprot:scaffold879_cov410-Prasinococcus_capsulatus_cf.AAC.23